VTIIITATFIGASFASFINVPTHDLSSPYGQIPYILYILCRFLASFVGVAGFALMFNSHVKIALTAGLIGGLANAARLSLLDFHVPDFVGAALAATLVGLLAALCVKYFDFSRINLSVPGILIMIPGYWLFKSAFELVHYNIETSAVDLTRAALVILALPVGLAVARFLTDRTWRHDQ
jgi:uncharacterized membrane protein YjjB (DUF3815 family)